PNGGGAQSIYQNATYLHSDRHQQSHCPQSPLTAVAIDRLEDPFDFYICTLHSEDQQKPVYEVVSRAIKNRQVRNDEAEYYDTERQSERYSFELDSCRRCYYRGEQHKPSHPNVAIKEH